MLRSILSIFVTGVIASSLVSIEATNLRMFSADGQSTSALSSPSTQDFRYDACRKIRTRMRFFKTGKELITEGYYYAFPYSDACKKGAFERETMSSEARKQKDDELKILLCGHEGKIDGDNLIHECHTPDTTTQEAVVELLNSGASPMTMKGTIGDVSYLEIMLKKKGKESWDNDMHHKKQIEIAKAMLRRIAPKQVQKKNLKEAIWDFIYRNTVDFINRNTVVGKHRQRQDKHPSLSGIQRRITPILAPLHSTAPEFTADEFGIIIRTLDVEKNEVGHYARQLLANSKSEQKSDYLRSMLQEPPLFDVNGPDTLSKRPQDLPPAIVFVAVDAAIAGRLEGEKDEERLKPLKVLVQEFKATLNIVHPQTKQSPLLKPAKEGDDHVLKILLESATLKRHVIEDAINSLKESGQGSSQNGCAKLLQHAFSQKPPKMVAKLRKEVQDTRSDEDDTGLLVPTQGAGIESEEGVLDESGDGETSGHDEERGMSGREVKDTHIHRKFFVNLARYTT